MGNQTTAQKDWAKIDAYLGTLHPSKEDELGSVFKEYVEESIHGGFDGFSSRDVIGIRRFLLDLITYHNNR